jgi:hypothetical protein
LRQRLAMPRFLVCILATVRKWSCARNPIITECKNFAITPSIEGRKDSLKLMTDAFNWKQQANVKICARYPNTYYVSARDGVPIDSVEVIYEYEKQMTECNWRSFQQFTDCALGYWKITMESNHNWINGKCTCPVFLKRYICKHLVGIAIMKINVI